MRNSENIKMLSELKPDYIGFIFYPKSKRFVGEDFGMPIIPSDIKRTGVFVNASKEYIMKKVVSHELKAVQLHGEETPYFCNDLMDENIEVIKSFGIEDAFDFETLEAYFDVCDYFLFDTKSPMKGGTGMKFNWDSLGRYSCDKPIILSGGIDLEDTSRIEDIDLKIHAVDINSRFEIEPAFKDIKKVKRFIESLRKNND